MLTVQEIQAMSFEKAVFGGYDAKTVDEFIEKLTEDYATVQKENAALKAKMKVLVDKIEEYRSVEDGMRRALVSAQSIAQETIDKAKLESQQMLEQTKNEMEAQVSVYQNRIASEAQRLSDAKQQCADFIAKMTAYYEEQLRGLVALSASDTLQITDALPSIGQNASPQAAEPLEITRDLSREGEQEKPPEKEYTIPEDIRKFMDQQQNPEDGLNVKMMEVTLNDEATQPIDCGQLPKTKFSFGELKFGADYSPESEK